MTHTIKQTLRRFWQRENGSATIEMLVFAPFLLWLMSAMFTYHDAVRMKSINVKAAYSVGDVLSRETDPINDDYMDGMETLLQFLTRSTEPVSLRVTFLRWNNKKQKYVREWSKVRGDDFTALKTWQLKGMAGSIPDLLHNERVIMVETRAQYTPTFTNIGLEKQDMYNLVVTRPRFTPRLVWDAGT